MSKRKSYLDELDRKEKLKEQRSQKVIESHKCNNCEWGTWTGIKYKCMFPNCVKQSNYINKG